MDISHANENGRSQRPVRGESRGQSRSSSSSSHVISRDGQRIIQVEEIHEHNKILRQQVQVCVLKQRRNIFSIVDLKAIEVDTTKRYFLYFMIIATVEPLY